MPLALDLAIRFLRRRSGGLLRGTALAAFAAVALATAALVITLALMRGYTHAIAAARMATLEELDPDLSTREGRGVRRSLGPFLGLVGPRRRRLICVVWVVPGLCAYRCMCLSATCVLALCHTMMAALPVCETSTPPPTHTHQHVVCVIPE